MYTTLLLSAMLAGSFAWDPAPSSKVSCTAASDKIIDFYSGPQLQTSINDACAAMMLPCAFPERLPKGAICVSTIDWLLAGWVKSVQPATIAAQPLGNRISGWALQFSVTPATQPLLSPGAFWTRQDCYGYFSYMLGKWDPDGCHTNKGYGVGNMTVGDDGSTLKDSVFEVKFVPK
ncbi:hypothetical protein GQ44DRAFT_728740 [Phaeosphaeriaceae sp. PMI808]|nr:hypothetical protein GQ44DRAFT_728740 [Phaeosphaeriaceae sp. PMI808]